MPAEIAVRRDLQHALEAIVLQRSVERVIAETVQSAQQVLFFRRAAFLGADRAGSQVDRVLDDGAIVTETVMLSPASSASFLAASSGVPIEGSATDLWVPLVDARKRYLMSAVLHDAQPFGFLYVDDPRSDPRKTLEVEALATLSAIAGVASRNALLFERSESLAFRDPLTGLLNRRAFAERLQQELEACRRHALSLLYIALDIDNFKLVNDRSGHSAGDALLRRLGTALVAMSRAQDAVARLGGDEFALVMTKVDPAQAASSLARINQLLRHAGVRCSLGAALYPRDGFDAATLSRAADRALYRAKATGKDRFAFA
jgi:diguanylate cyclase (GGDEF)-like protein